MVKLVLLRHGESTANEANIYTGWSDVPLTIKGCEQAKVAGKKLKEENIIFSIPSKYLKYSIDKKVK